MRKPEFEAEPTYNEFEKVCLARIEWFSNKEAAYVMIQASKPRTLGFALHDSPVGMLAWMTDKLYMWTDSYPWSPTELITWTLLHYFPGPTTGLQMYRENDGVELATALQSQGYLKQPTGISAFPKEFGYLAAVMARDKCKYSLLAGAREWRALRRV